MTNQIKGGNIVRIIGENPNVHLIVAGIYEDGLTELHRLHDGVHIWVTIQDIERVEDEHLIESKGVRAKRTNEPQLGGE